MIRELERGSARVILLRHGQTTMDGFMVGKESDPPLSDEGVNQAINASDALKKYGEAAWDLSSPKVRASMSGFLATGISPLETPLLDESEFGKLDGEKVDLEKIKNLREPIGEDHEWVKKYGVEPDEEILARERDLIEGQWEMMKDHVTRWWSHARRNKVGTTDVFREKGLKVTKLDNLSVIVFDISPTSKGWKKTFVESSGIHTAPIAA